MHPSFQARVDELGELLQKTHAARAEFFGRVARRAPPKPVRFQVAGESVGMFQVIDLTSGKTRAFRENYKAAHDLAIMFEEKVNRLQRGAK